VAPSDRRSAVPALAGPESRMPSCVRSPGTPGGKQTKTLAQRWSADRPSSERVMSLHSHAGPRNSDNAVKQLSEFSERL